MVKIFIDQEKGLTFPDKKVITELRRLINLGNDFSIGGEFEFTVLRLLIALKIVNVEIYHDNDKIIIDEKGQCYNYPRELNIEMDIYRTHLLVQAGREIDTKWIKESIK